MRILSFVSPVVACLLASGCNPPTQSTTPPKQPVEQPASTTTPAQIVANSELPTPNATPLAGDKMGVTVHRLKNGLTVYISTDRQKPRFNAWIAVRAGSRHDPANSTGLAHYLEHMLFKGTDEFGTQDFAAEQPHLARVGELYTQLRQTDDPSQREALLKQLDEANQASGALAIPNEFDRMYKRMGVEGVNAFTSDEQTVYIADIPSNRLEAWATVEAERFADPSFRQFFTEIEAVYEEKNLSLDNPWSRTDEALMLGMFPTHPYGTQPTIGTSEHLKNPAYQDMVDYFHRWYVPNNMAVVLAGDIDPETALPVLEKTLGAWQPKTLEKPAPGQITPLAGRNQTEVTVEGSEGVMLAWHTVPTHHPDAPALRVMDWLMDNSTSGLLNTELELTQKVPDAGSYLRGYIESGMWVVRATNREGQSHEEVEQLLRDVVARLQAGEFTQADIDAVVVNQDISDKRRLESAIGRVSKMASAFVSRMEWKDVLAQDEALRKVTREDVIRVARTYLGDNYLAVYQRNGKQDLPKIDKPKITPLKVDPKLESPFAKNILAMPATELQPQWLVEGEHYVHEQLPAGPMIAARNTRNDLFSLEYTFDFGSRTQPLLCHAFELLEQSGAGETSADAFQKQLFALGTSIDFSCTADNSGVEISGVDKNLEASVKLLQTWLSSPQLSPETLKKLNKNVLSQRKDRTDNSRFLARATTEFAKFGKQSSVLQEPSNKQIKRAQVKKLGKLISGFANHQHHTLYFGPRSASDIKPIVALGSNHKKVAPPRVTRYRKQQGAQIYFLHRDTAKANISLVFPIGNQPRDKRPAAKLFSEYFGGDMSAVVFQEIREVRGLAYSAWGYAATGRLPDDDWALVGGMGTQSDKTPEALKTYLELVQDRPVDDGRLQATRESVEQDYRASRIDPRWIVYWVQSWDRRGEQQDPRPWEREQIQNMTIQQVEGFAETFKAAPVILTIVGDRQKIDLEKLKAIAPITEVKLDTVLPWGAFGK